YLKGRVSAVLGTHTHVPTADEQVLPGGTAFISDVGMTGPYDSILGRRIDRVLSTTVTFVPSAFDVATGDPRLAGAGVDIAGVKGQIRLRCVGGPAKGRAWESSARLRVGRQETAEVRLDDASVSRQHAELAPTERGWRVRDAGSTNGTYLNGNRLGKGDWPLQ